MLDARQSPQKSTPGALQSRKREAAIAALLNADTVGAAAEAAGVNPKTLRRWLLDAEFRAAFGNAKAQMLDHALARLSAASSSATATLLAVCRDQDASPAARVTAARTVLELALKVRSEQEFEDRLRRLEEAHASQG